MDGRSELDWSRDKRRSQLGLKMTSEALTPLKGRKNRPRKSGWEHVRFVAARQQSTTALHIMNL